MIRQRFSFEVILFNSFNSHFLVFLSFFCSMTSLLALLSTLCLCRKSGTKVYETEIGLKSLKFFTSISCIWYMAIKAQSIAGKKLISVCLFLLRLAAERGGGWVESWEATWIVEFYSRIHGFLFGCFGNWVYSLPFTVHRLPFTVQRCRWNHLCMHMRRIDYSCWSLAFHSHPRIPIDLSLVSVSRLNCICSTSTIRLAPGGSRRQQVGDDCRFLVPDGGRRIKPN